MTLVERYIFRIAFNAFVSCLLALTGVIWLTQALRELDLVTGKGQTILVFLTVTALTLPSLVAVIAPVALFIATIHALNKLNADSELIVMSAAGMPPRRILRPFLWLAAYVALGMGVLTFYLAPTSGQELRDLVTRIRADFVANVVQEGQFTSLESGITFHFRERSGDALLGVLIQDRREPDNVVIYLAERGQATDINGQGYLVLEEGSVHRQRANQRDSSIVAFERYAVDLAAFSPGGEDVTYKPRERTTTQLLFPDVTEGYYQSQRGRFRAELHDRLSAWLYPFAVMLIAFAAFGNAQTTRQGRGAAMVGAIIGVVVLRSAGFATSSAAVRSPGAVVLVYAVPLLGIGLSLFVLSQSQRVRGLGQKAASWLRHAAILRLPIPGRA